MIDNDILFEIARCESDYVHYKKNGSVLTGRIDPRDTGLFQINTRWNGDEARKLGMDIYTLEGNISFARYLFNKRGTRDWKASAGCWDK